MIYLSILLIAAGIVIFIYSFIIEPKTNSLSVDDKIPHHEYSSNKLEKAEYTEKVEAGLGENNNNTDYKKSINDEDLIENYTSATEELRFTDDKGLQDLTTIDNNKDTNEGLTRWEHNDREENPIARKKGMDTFGKKKQYLRAQSFSVFQ